MPTFDDETRARGTFLYFLDHDDLLESDALEKLCLAALSHRAKWIVSGIKHFGVVDRYVRSELNTSCGRRIDAVQERTSVKRHGLSFNCRSSRVLIETT